MSNSEAFPQSHWQTGILPEEIQKEWHHEGKIQKRKILTSGKEKSKTG